MKNFITENWDTILSLIIQRQGLTDVAVNTWIRPFTVYEVKDNWGRTPSGWVCLDYCEVM